MVLLRDSRQIQLTVHEAPSLSPIQILHLSLDFITNRML